MMIPTGLIAESFIIIIFIIFFLKARRNPISNDQEFNALRPITFKEWYFNTLKEWFWNIFRDIKIEFGNPLKLIFIPMLVILLYFIVVVIISRYVPQISLEAPSPDTLILYIIFSGIIAPIAEQIVQGVLLSGAFVGCRYFCKNKFVKYITISVTLIIVSLGITYIHHREILPSAIIFLSFIIYGTMYCIYKRNLVPSIVSHSFWNLLLLYPYLMN